MIIKPQSSYTLQWIDSLRALAMLGVIVIHVTSPVVNMTYNRNMEHWWIGEIVLSSMRYAVPIFVMLSGATLLGKDYKLIDFYKKRITRVLFPAIFWLLAYWIFRWFMLKPLLRPHNFDAVLQWAIELFQKEGVSKHLWYIYMILFLYLFLPFIGKFIRSISSTSILYILIFWVLINTLELTKVISFDSIPQIFRKLYGYSLYAGYLILGYYLSVIVKKAPSRWIYFLILSSTIVLASLVSYYLSRQTGKLNMTFLNTFSANTIAQAITVFMLLKNYTLKNKYVAHVSKIISEYSFGIYLVHVMLLNYFFRLGIFWTMAHPLISIPTITIFSLICSFTIIYLLRKIPYCNYISG